MSATTSQAAGGPPPGGRARQLSSSPFKVVAGERNAARDAAFVPPAVGGTLRPAAA